ncbi:ATP-dependent bile acid permease [Exidia glandulosa HHB12029]|uniref:ATP-dependent bile acid permease n=1 Tax=Exidia glandulosa HHB12029 TaxID=1314781 RepID=A0A165DCD8_EXIGL|nr:ATP-dependent bile acid permease [Exidia glandulosa HHB12029]
MQSEPAPPGFGEGKTTPDAHANILQTLTFSWLTPLLRVGWGRPLEEKDLWEMDAARQASNLTDTLEKSFYDRAPPFKRPRAGGERPNYGSTSDPVGKDDHGPDVTVQSLRSATPLTPAKARAGKRYDMSLLKAIYTTYIVRIWVSSPGVLKVATPLVTKLLIQYITDAFNDAHNAPGEPDHARSVGYGFGLAVAIFAMGQIASLLHNASYFGTLMLGFRLRTSLLSVVFRKSLRLSGRARLEHTSGQITTIVSADTSRLDNATGFIHVLWSSPLIIAIGVALLIVNLGPSALVGLAVLVLAIPVQGFFVGRMMNLRRHNVESTDKRVRLMQEVIQGIRVLVLFNWQSHYMERVVAMRTTELKNVRRLALLRGVMTAIMAFMPILAAILTFVTYSLTGHNLDAATIFSSLQLFNTIKDPLTLFPLTAAAFSDGLVSLRRIRKLLLAEEGIPVPASSHTSSGAVSVHGSFTWEHGKLNSSPAKLDKKATEAKDKAYDALLQQWSEGIPVDEYAGERDGPEPFRLDNISLDVKPGSFVAIVGRVASGKSSLLQAIVGEMRRTAGSVNVGGAVAYAPQSPWIQGLSLRENILFGNVFDEDRFNKVLRACALEHDIAILPDGVDTEIGERGVNVSGGQKARIALARAAYQDSDIVLLDDPLSAVDADVSRQIVDGCLLDGPLADKTRILVTHQLHVLPRVDEIIHVEGGKIVERGSFSELVSRGGSFAELVEEFGIHEKREQSAEIDSAPDTKNKSMAKEKTDKPTAAAKVFAGDEVQTGAVAWAAYLSYLRAAGGVHWAFILLAGVVLAQAATVVSSVVLGFWTETSLPGFSNGHYMALYSGLGLATAFLTFLAAIGFAYAGFNASLTLFSSALKGVLFTNLQWHEKTPTGAITSRLSKDIDMVDSTLPRDMMTLLENISAIAGTIALVFYSYAWLGLIFPPLAIIYWFASTFYRRTSVEIRRIDARLRTLLYASFTEALTGVAVIRAYGAENRFVQDSEKKLDSENRCWLSIRMDFLANLLLLGIGLFAVGFRNSTEPAKMAVVITYALNLTGVMLFTALIIANVEADMNAVERIHVYSELPPESQIADVEVDDVWPTNGAITFENVQLRYGPELPLALKGITFDVKAGEKVGIVGRTGAGKSSLLATLFRVSPTLTGGRILIDGTDIAHIGLNTLRKALAVIPQDAIVFAGPLRTNIDPEGRASDADLHAALKRVELVDGKGKFDLDRHVGADSFSAGEKQLLAMCRALVRTQSKILDMATDAVIQAMIQQDFKANTVLCIAHRLSTIAYYDKILVLHDGTVAECDSPLALYDAGGLFHSMCEQASLSRDDIVRMRAAL